MAETTNTPLMETTLKALLDNKRYYSLRDILTTMQAADVASIFETLNEEQLPLLFRLLPKELAADTFVEMEPETQELLIRTFSDTELKAIVDELYVDDAVDIVEEMPANVVQRILAQASPEMRKSINELLRYPEDSAGSLMTTEYVDLRAPYTVAEAIARIRRIGPDKETINTCYVLATDRRLIGVVTIRSLLLASDDSTITDIMDTNVYSVTTSTDQEEVARLFSRYDCSALPVVDHENRMVGIVTFDDAMDVMEEEVTEDIEKMAAITPSEHTYMRSGTFEIFKNRIPWLLLLMVSATFTGMILQHFETALAAQAALVAFIPMLMDTGGNSGSQASVTIIRGLSLGELSFVDLPKVAWKEARVSLLCGAVLAMVGFGKIMLFDHLIMGNNSITFFVAITVSLTLMLTVFVAKLVGCSLPMFAKKLGFDPAVMASPFITTIVDALSLLLYFQVAAALLHI